MAYTGSGDYTQYTYDPSTADPQDSSSYDQTYYTSGSSEGEVPSSRSSMTNHGYEKKHRVPDTDKYITSYYSQNNNVEVTNHRKGIIEPDAPRSGDATSTHYAKTSSRKSTHRSKRH